MESLLGYVSDDIDRVMSFYHMNLQGLDATTTAHPKASLSHQWPSEHSDPLSQRGNLVVAGDQ